MTPAVGSTAVVLPNIITTTHNARNRYFDC